MIFIRAEEHLNRIILVKVEAVLKEREVIDLSSQNIRNYLVNS